MTEPTCRVQKSGYSFSLSYTAIPLWPERQNVKSVLSEILVKGLNNMYVGFLSNKSIPKKRAANSCGIEIQKYKAMKTFKLTKAKDNCKEKATSHLSKQKQEQSFRKSSRGERKVDPHVVKNETNLPNTYTVRVVK